MAKAIEFIFGAFFFALMLAAIFTMMAGAWSYIKVSEFMKSIKF